MRFAHLADCHIGSWRDPVLRENSKKAFCKAIDDALERGVDFILISGDLFHTAQPPIEHLRDTVLKLKQCHDRGVPVYIISGSHDYSPSGKTMLDVLDAAGLARNVGRGIEVEGKLRLAFTIDNKTGVKICGMVGRKGSLEKEYYGNLDLLSLESEPGIKIFMFHSAVMEHRPSWYPGGDAIPLSLFPKGFVYYAGGHVHAVDCWEEKGYGMFAMSGPTYPENFEELERLGSGGFRIFECDQAGGRSTYIPIQIHPVKSICIKVNGKTPSTVEKMIREEAEKDVSQGCVVVIRIEGTLDQGKLSDISWGGINELFKSKGAILLRNTSKLSSPELSPVKPGGNTVDEIEDAVICEHAGQMRIFEKNNERRLIRSMMTELSIEKGDGETNASYEERLAAACRQILDQICTNTICE